jgi:hypothetical protein
MQVLSFLESFRRPFHTQHPSRLVRIFALCVQVVLLDKAIVLVLCPCRRASPIVRPPRCSLARRSILGNRVARIDPVGVDVYRGREVIDVCLEGLAADFALEVADARLLLDGYGHGLLVVAEEAIKGRWELLLL